MQSTRNRKGQTSITHLMNFALPPRPQNHTHSHNPRNARRNPTWGLGSGYHAADKARYSGQSATYAVSCRATDLSRYIHANYRFIVDPRGDYRAQAVDADVHLDWANVLQILASAKSQSANCPICLGNPVAPRMAKCGHIFCLPCLLRYMHSTDEMGPFPDKKQRWKKCPICWDSVYLSETRPVRWFTGQEGDPPQEGCDVVLRLIERPQGSTLALPRDGAPFLEADENIPWYIAAEVMDYARVMRGGEEYMSSEYDREREELQHQEREDELIFGEDMQWTQKAISAIAELKGRLKGLGNPPTVSTIPNERKARRAPLKNQEHHTDSPDYHLAQHTMINSPSPSATSLLPTNRPLSTAADVPDISLPNQVSGAEVPSAPYESRPAMLQHTSIPRTSSINVRSTLPQQDSTPFFFYEALLHFYLSPLDVRILRSAFGEYSSFPSTILPRVERVSTGHIVDDELRRRAKYLAHLPRGCEVAFLECDWTDTVSADVLGGFSAELERRRKRNREKEAREEKERIRAEKEEDAKGWAAARRRRPAASPDVLDSAHVQPPANGNGTELTSSSIDSGFTSSSPPWSSGRAHSGSAFASLASPSTSPVAARTVWGTTAVASSTLAVEPVHPKPQAAEDDGWLQNWADDLPREDEVSLQLARTTIDSDDKKTAEGGTSNRKKKGKKITLMSTNARRGA